MRLTCRWLLACGLLAAACSGVELQSRWTENAIAVDGREGEWLGDFTYLEKLGLGVAVRNDARHLYLCIVARNRALEQQVLRRGMVLRIDPAGGMRKAIGIHFPL